MNKQEQLQDLYETLLPLLERKIEESEEITKSLRLAKDTVSNQSLLIKYGLVKVEDLDAMLQAIIEIVTAENLSKKFVVSMLTSAFEHDRVST